MKKLIRNVTMLDMRTALPESVEGLEIRNAMTVIVTPATRPLLAKINFKNLMKVAEIPEGVALAKVNGNMVVGGNAAGIPEASAYNMINGDLIIKNDISAEDIAKLFVHGGSVNGDIITPDTLSAVIASVGVEINGRFKVYPADSILYVEGITINNGFLKGLAPDSKITVIGDIIIEAGTNPEMFERSIAELHIFGDVTMYAAVRESFYKAAKKYEDITTLPDGYTYYKQDITVSAFSLFSFKNKKLYTPNNVLIMDSLTENQVRQNDFRIQTEGTVFCPEALAECVFDKVTADQFLTYRGTLQIVNDEATVTEGESAVSYLVNGELSIPESLSAKALDKAVADIFSYGTIYLREYQQSVVNKKMVINEGDFEIIRDAEEETDSGSESKEEVYDVVINNVMEYVL